jgi:uncharacterized membrane protein
VKKPHPLSIIPKFRLDALTDGLFAITMTLLIIDIRLPEHFRPQDGHQLVEAILELSRNFIAFAVSFFVLGFRWMSLARLMHGLTHVSRGFVFWSLVHLFLIACMPFSAMLVGRYTEFAPSIWIYSLNTIAAALVAIRLLVEPTLGKRSWYRNEKARDLLWLIAAALVSLAISFFNPSYAMAAYLLTLPLARTKRRRKA